MMDGKRIAVVMPAYNAEKLPSQIGRVLSVMNFNQGRPIMKNNCLCATLLGFWAALGLAQTTEELINEGKNTENVTTQSMGYDRKSY